MAIRHKLANGCIHIFSDEPTRFLVVCTACVPTVVNRLTGTEQTAIDLADEHAVLLHAGVDLHGWVK